MERTLRLRTAIAFLLFSLLISPIFGREPLPLENGKSGLELALRKLRTTARLMHTAAHPDDEDGGMLTLQSRGHGVVAVQMTLTRGEGGQNAVGKELGDELGMLRTLELLEADRYYGVEQRFSRVADFGFSKSAEETLTKWDARNTALADIVRVIRTFRPEVVISRFIGDPSDGHGQHQASGILTRDAFRAAGDPTKFPEQIKEGLQPYQPKKLYVRARGDDWNVELDVNSQDPALGASYVAFGWKGLKHQLSQGSANWQMPTRMWTSHYKLADTTIPNYKPGREKDFFDGIDTGLMALASIAPQAESLKAGVQQLDGYVAQATKVADANPKSAAEPLLRGFAKTQELIAAVKKLPISGEQMETLIVALETKRDQFRDAANLALGVTLKAVAELPAMNDVKDPAAQLWLAATPESQFTLRLTSTGMSQFTPAITFPPGAVTQSSWRGNVATVSLSRTAPYTRQYWYRDDPERESIYKISDPEFETLPLTPWPFAAKATYRYKGLEGEVTTTVEVAQPKEHPLIIGPELSVATPSWTAVRSVGASDWTSIPITLKSNERVTNDSPVPHVRLSVPEGWKTNTPRDYGELSTSGKEMHVKGAAFQPANSHEQRAAATAIADLGKQQFEVGYSPVSRDDLGTAYYFRKATQPVSIVDVKVPQGLKVGYIMGVGDDIPDVLRSIGVNVTVISPEELKSGDLSKYGTIVLGIRAHEAREDLRQYNQRLLDFAQNGGTLMVQYVYQTQQFNDGKFAPYPLNISRNNKDRVTVEEAPVEILAQDSPAFQSPNKISQKDFDGWVQERALYCPTEWDSHYQPLLSSNDPGDPPEKGGLLVAKYGKGTYIFNAWSFFRQLPAGVPGAIRLYVNLLSLGHQ
ncbi:MAG TPA: PIG-L family deacetylase [Terriglobales bacterium]|nr:PIG-L family deacetylase [Terriglobales bacterium]